MGMITAWLVELFDLLVITAEITLVFEFCQGDRIYSPSPGQGQIATWPILLGVTFKIKLHYVFPRLYLFTNSKLRYSHKLTESLPLSLPLAPDGFYHLMKPDSFFPQVLSFIINFKPFFFWVQRDREVAQ